jgi:large subunit ribosomal protein L17
MRHKVAGYKLGRSKDERIALRRNLVNQLFEHERIQTTRTKALAIRGQAERLITLAKRGRDAGDAQMVHARRLAAARMSNPDMVKKLFDDLAPRYAERPGGYTRMLKLGPRLGDSAEMVIIELVEE